MVRGERGSQKVWPAQNRHGNVSRRLIIPPPPSLPPSPPSANSAAPIFNYRRIDGGSDGAFRFPANSSDPIFRNGAIVSSRGEFYIIKGEGKDGPFFFFFFFVEIVSFAPSRFALRDLNLPPSFGIVRVNRGRKRRKAERSERSGNSLKLRMYVVGWAKFFGGGKLFFYLRSVERGWYEGDDSTFFVSHFEERGGQMERIKRIRVRVLDFTKL